MNEQLKMLEHLLTENWVQVDRALAVAAKNGLTEVMRILLRSFRRFNETALHRSHALEHAAAAGHVGVLALLLEHCSTVDEDWSAEFTTPALMEAAMAGQTDAVVMLLPRCKAFTVSKALAIAVFFEHEDMVESLLGSCPPTEMIPALVAATDTDSLELFERVFAKCAPYGGLSFHEKESFCSCFISAASRGCEEIVKLLVSGLVLSSEYPAQKAIRLVLEDAAASSKYELVRIILDAFTSAKLRLSFAVVSPAFKKAHARNDQEMLELLTKYCGEYMVDFCLPSSCGGQVGKKQRKC